MDEDQLRQAFVWFGGVRYCRLVSDPNTGIVRGVCAVCVCVCVWGGGGGGGGGRGVIGPYSSLATCTLICVVPLQVLRLCSSMIILQLVSAWKLLMLEHSK